MTATPHRSSVTVFLAVLAFVLLPGTAFPAERYVAYEVPAGTAGNQDAPGALGKDFDLNLAIQVVRLGVFDSNSDGLNLTITARLYDRATGLEEASIAFTPADPGELVGGSRFKDLDPPLELPAGFQGCIIAEGYGATEMNGNCHGNLALKPWTTNAGNCAIEFVGTSRYGAALGVLPAGADGGPADRYASGTFEFEPLEDPVPEPAIAYIVEEFALGNFPFSGPLGMDFDTQVDIVVNRLGVFDSLSDGLFLPVTAILYERDSRAELAVVEFPSEDPGVLVDGSRFKDLDPPLAIPAGTRCTIVAEGYGVLEPGGSLWAGGLPLRTDSGSCAIRFVGSSRIGFVPGEFPSAPDFGPANRYAAGTIDFEPAPSAVPRPQPPTGVGAALEAGGVRVSWTAAGGVPAPVGYNVYRRVGGEPFQVNASPVAGTSFLATGLIEGLECCFAVRAVAAGGIQSDPSVEACALPPAPAQPAQAAIAIQVPEGTAGNQNVGPATALGIDFVARVGITVTRLGVFDDGSDGLTSTLTARLHDRATGTEVASLTFTPGEPGLLVGGNRFKALPTPIGLPAGFQGTIAAEGFGLTDRNGNLNQGAFGAVDVDRGGCAIELTGHRTGPAGFFPAARDTSISPAAYAAGTFEFAPAGAPPPSSGERVAHVVPEGTRGNQNFAGFLGLDFDVEETIVVTRLGVFDDGSDGLALPITAYLYDRRTREAVASLAFTPEDSGDLEGGSRFKPLDPPLSLPAGFQGTIAAEGYGDLEMNGNVHGIEGLAPWTVDSGGCRISFVGGGRPGPAGAFPTALDWGPVNRYAAGTFSFVPGPSARFTATPEEGVEPLEVSLDATASSSPNGAIVQYGWAFGDGATGSGATLKHTYASPGVYTIALTVEDASGLEATATSQVTVHFRTGDISPWISEDIGSPLPLVKGGARPAAAGGCIEVHAGGKDIGGLSDQFHFLHQAFDGDFVLACRLSDLSPTAGAKVGLMVRENLTAGSRHVSLLVTNTPPLQCAVVQRKNANAITTLAGSAVAIPPLPDAWLRLERKGAEVIASFSSDGADWLPVATVPFAFPQTVEGGLAATARDAGETGASLDATICDLSPSGTVEGFRRADPNDDGTINITDGIFVLNFLFLGGPTPPCMDAADSNDDSVVNITDGIFILNFLFLGGPAPPAPGTETCGPDVGADELAPCAYTHCG